MQSVDSHAHIFDLNQPMLDERRYTPPRDAALAQYLAMLDANGIARGVLVQPSFLGTDNSFMVQALREHPQRLRGIAVVEPGISDAALDSLATAGVSGIRLNLVGRPLEDFGGHRWRALFASLASRNWQVEIHRQAADLARVIPALLAAGAQKIVVDHFGRPDPILGIDDPGFRYLLTLGGSRRVWVKLSGAYRNGERGDAIARDAVPLLRQSFGLERLVWGSDWPHNQFEERVTYAATRAQLDAWLPDAAERRVVLCNSPAELFGW
jgi:predicted TIM-barrel fold metal-dependent hydrolase